MKQKIKNGTTYNKNGFKYVHVKGNPKERGYAYGYCCAEDFKEIQKMLKFYMFESYGYSWDYFIEEINNSFKEKTKTNFKEYYEEMEGISEGCNANGCKTNIDEIIAVEFYLSIPYWFSFKSQTHVGKEGGGLIKGGSPSFSISDKCSAFMAIGKDWTKDGNIVVAHNSFSDYIDGQYSYVILDMYPDKGHRFIMQTSPCWIWSGTDFFVTSAGIIGTETTIGGFIPYEENTPIGYRIRNAMQYGNTLDDYVDFLLDGNSGDYANSWLFGDINRKEILRIELGLKYNSVSRTKNGYFIGFNAPYDPRIRNIDVNNSGFYDIRRHQGARRVRLQELMEQHKGKIDIDIAKKIIADHYDVYLKKENPCSRTVCSHYDLDAREYMSQADRPKPYAPHGAVDGFVTDSNLAKQMKIIGRYGSSCGTPFDKTEFCKQHIQYENFCSYLKDRPSQPWTEFNSIDYKKHNIKNKNKKSIKDLHHNHITNQKINKKHYILEKVIKKNNFIKDYKLKGNFYTNKEIDYFQPKHTEIIRNDNTIKHKNAPKNKTTKKNKSIKNKTKKIKPKK